MFAQTAPEISLSTSPAQAEQRPLLGVFLVVITVLFFALSDVISKHLTMQYPVPVVLALRYLASTALLFIFVFPKMKSKLWKTQRTGMVIFRGAILTLASLTMGFALRLMPVGEAVTILYLSPFAVMALAVPLLGERANPMSWFLATLGFCGVLLILRPGTGLDPQGVLWALANAGCATAFHLVTRTLTKTESAMAMLFYVTIIGAAVFTLSALPYFGSVEPSLLDWGLMLLLGGFATMGHFFFAAAYREAPSTLIAPLNYLHLVWAGILGWVVFDHIPDQLSIIGMATVTLAGAALALNAHFVKGRTKV